MDKEKRKIEISVIIPVYNVEKFIEKCLDSVLEQTFKEYEIIVVNDGSTDKSQGIIQKYVENYSGIVFGYEKENGGLSDARNYGIEKAKGKYITFLDSDDYLDKDYLEVLYAAAEKNKSDMICGGQKKVAADGTILAVIEYPIKKNPNTISRRLNISGKLYRREYLLNLGLQFAYGKTYEDDPFNLRALFMAKNLKLLAYEGYNQLVREGSITSKRIEKEKIPFEALEETIRYVTEQKENCNDYSAFEYTVLSFFTYFIFQANKSHAYLKQSKSRKSNVDIVLQFCDYTITILKKYMPDYYRNKHIGILKNRELPLKQRVGTFGYVWLCRTGLLKTAVRIYYKL